MDEKSWPKNSHEAKVQGFYGTGAENFWEYHGGYLNFGLWENGIADYVEAAENLVSTIGRMAGLDRNSRLLDVGCGHGAQDVFLHEKFGCGIDALDVTWKHVVNARKRVEKAGIDSAVKVHHGTATKLDFPDSHFTQVTSIEAPEHFNTRADFLKEAYRVLKPNGVIAIADYVVNRPARKLWEKFVLEMARRLWHVPKANYETSRSYAARMEKIGFKNITVKEVGKYTIPGYYAETTRPENVKQLEKIRGYFAAHAGWVIDYFLLKAFEKGLIEYVLVRAEK